MTEISLKQKLRLFVSDSPTSLVFLFMLVGFLYILFQFQFRPYQFTAMDDFIVIAFLSVLIVLCLGLFLILQEIGVANRRLRNINKKLEESN